MMISGSVWDPVKGSTGITGLPVKMTGPASVPVKERRFIAGVGKEHRS